MSLMSTSYLKVELHGINVFLKYYLIENILK